MNYRSSQHRVLARRVVAVTTAVGLFIVLSPRAHTQAPRGHDPVVVASGYEAVDGEVLVKFRSTHSPADHASVQSAAMADEDEAIGSHGVRRLHSRVFTADQLVSMLRLRTDVEYAEPNYVVRTTAVPNDPLFSTLWALSNTGQSIWNQLGIAGDDIGALSAWGVTTGSRANVVGIVDTGIDYTHPDLVANVWSAPASFSVTIGSQTITCAAGTHGFNAITNACDPKDDHYHGTHVSGTVGAVGNNGTAVVGVNWTASLMGLKFLDSTGSGTTANAINAIDFAIQAKTAFASTAAANVRVLSASWGGGGFSQALLDEINKANTNDMLFVAAAGNSASNNDQYPFYPAAYTAPNLITVAATDNRDQLAYFSNYGPTTVHLGAPGVGILSTYPGGGTLMLDGTSMATPHVSGAAALVLSSCALGTSDLRHQLLSSVDAISALAGKVSTGGRLDVNRAVRTCPGTQASLTSPTPNSTFTGPSMTFQWSAGSYAYGYWLTIGKSAGNGDYYGRSVGTNLSATVTGLPADGSTVYVRLWTNLPAGWQYTDYTFRAMAYIPPALVSPQPGSTLTSSSATFSWTAGSNVTEYWLTIGRSLGSSEYYGHDEGTLLTQTVTGFPTDGSRIYVRLWGFINSNWQYADYVYTAASVTAAQLSSPTPLSTFSSSTVTFQWNATGSSDYWLTIGRSAGNGDYYGHELGTATSAVVSGLPTDGSTVYVRLWSLVGQSWLYVDTTFTAMTTVTHTALTSPTPSSTLTGTSVTFQWTATTGITMYWLSVGLSPGGATFYGGSVGTNLSATVSGLPSDGSTVYVRLWTDVNSVWQYTDYTFTAATTGMAQLTSPTPGTTLSSSTVTFQWSAVTGCTYWLTIGRAQGNGDYYGHSVGSNLSATISGLPTDGSTVYVRLWTTDGTSWQYVDYTFTASH